MTDASSPEHLSIAPPMLSLAADAAPAQAITSAPTPPFVVRIWCAFTCIVCFGMLGVGLYLTPDPSGTGTHQQLGLPPCGFYRFTGYPCPTCGCTTSVSHFAHGQWIASFVTQPFGFVVGLASLVAGCLCAIGLVTGKWVGPAIFTLEWYWRVWVYGGIGVLVGAWVYKIMMVRLVHG